MLVGTAACGDTQDGDGADGGPDPDATASPSTESSAEPTTDRSGATQSPEESFRAWLVASRKPDAALACTYLTSGLVEKMIAELATSGLASVSSCEELTELSAALFKAAGTDAEVVVDTREQGPSHAELWVEYVSSGKCGTVDMVPSGGQWVMTEQSEVRC
ncbi:hypothetical protein RB608_20425 [Nocardioides sp. LHD-245]|uniref:hypothetical protein n=1 Tax=Nocardioides sp. LHD-245 TaxID=3051387 RepID=UPI0027E00182|nr:hypothetical protein [Nocardioides sp. LHD-245]